MAQGFPLQWPEGWTRTPIENRRRSPYKITPDQAARELRHSLELLGALSGSLVISSNVPLRKDGLPYADARPPSDCGVAVYWTTKTHAERVMACDRWLLVHENIRAIGLAVDGLRAIDRAGASQILERAYSAFGALPPSSAAPPVLPWWEVLGFTKEMLAVLSVGVTDARYRELAAKAHPDRGGTAAAMVALNNARDQARAHYESR